MRKKSEWRMGWGVLLFAGAAMLLADPDRLSGEERSSGSESQPAPRLQPGPGSRAVATTPEGDLPPYLLPSHTAWDGAPSWLVLGFEQRFRYENRAGRWREPGEATSVHLGASRARAFFGVAPENSGFGFSLEIEDARLFATHVPRTAANVNDLDILQLRVDLDLERWLGAPIRIDLGRSSFDAIDRRLVARNRFRNTTNAFEGLRVMLGPKNGALGAELLALFPTQRRSESLDRLDEGRRLFGALGRVSFSSIVLEPYYWFHESNSVPRQSLHTVGVHLFGAPGDRGFDHDVDVAFQGGTDGDEAHRAFALHAELGRTLRRSMSPRLALWMNYASGDHDPADHRNQRFDPLFGASHAMYGFTDLFAWQNLMSPTLALSLRPAASVRTEVFYRLYWLASPRDAFVRAGLRDPTGNSGSFVGQEIDASLHCRVSRIAELELQYGELVAGSFVDRVGGGRGARMLAGSLVLQTGGNGP